MPARAQSQGRDIVFSLKMVADPGNASEAKKFSGQGIPPGRGNGSRPGGGNSEERDAARARAAAEREEERIHKRHRERQLERARRGREARDEETRDHARALAAQEREEERVHNRHRQRQLERARRNRAARVEEQALAMSPASDITGYGGVRNSGVAQRYAMRQAMQSQRHAGLRGMGAGAMELGMGALHLGLVGQEDHQKVMDTVLLGSGAYHAMSGASKLGGGLSTLAGGMGMAAGGGIATVSAAAVAALASVGVALKMIHEVGTGAASDVNSFTQRMGRAQEWMQRGMLSIANPNGSAAAGDQPYTAAYAAEQRTLAMRKSRDAMLEQKARAEGFGGIRAGGANTLFDARLGAMRTGTIEDQRIGLHNENQRAEADVRGAETDAEREAAQQRILKIQERMVELAEHSKETARQEGELKLRTAREAMNASKEELDNRKETMKALKESVMSSAERFANLDEKDQMATLAAGRVVREAKEARARGMTGLAQAKINSLTKKQRGLLSATGLEDATGAARESGVNEARRKGFFAEFGDAERTKFAKEEALAQKLEIRLKEQQQVVVKVENDLEEVSRQVINAVNFENDKKIAFLTKRLQEDQDRQFIEFTRAFERDRRSAPAGGR